ncbi:MAG: sulfite exporter TauE/SafE family protein [Bacteroidia bacterium]|nr:sulfite exporter TauE/SafE family protein [Bacteroidia bacterium]
MEQHTTALFLILLATVAFAYASVGHGGASGYLALGAVMGIAGSEMKPVALILNIIVSAVAFFQYYRAGYFQRKLFWPFAITSVPASFIGALFTPDDNIYKKILGVLLLLGVLRILGLFGKGKEFTKQPTVYWPLLAGALIGFLSGLIGIGGGIILTPLILILGWAGLKETAAVSALFILVNSVSGMIGLATKGISLDPVIWIWIVIAAVAGLAGSWAGSRKIGGLALKSILAITLTIACLKLIFT